MQTPRNPVNTETDNADTDKEELAEGSLLSHLVELRDRLTRSLLAVTLIFVPLLPFNQKIFAFAAGPIIAALPEGDTMVATAPLQTLLAPFKLTFYIAFLLAMPYVLYQAWAFVAPGLYKKEKRFAFPLLGSSILLFYLGAAFAFYVVGPLIFQFTAALAENNEAFALLPEIKEYLGLLTSLVLIFGIAFEIPIATVLLAWTGLVSVAKLTSVRPYVFLMAFVVGMFLTPPDVISQTLLAVPVYLLYELGIIMARIFAPKRDIADEAVAADQ